jgi:hypothetical protein
MAPVRLSQLGERIKVIHGIVRPANGGEDRGAANLILR